MNRYSKTQLRKGAVKASRPANASKSTPRTNGVSREEEELLFGNDPPVDRKPEK